MYKNTYYDPDNVDNRQSRRFALPTQTAHFPPLIRQTVTCNLARGPTWWSLQNALYHAACITNIMVGGLSGEQFLQSYERRISVEMSYMHTRTVIPKAQTSA